MARAAKKILQQSGRPMRVTEILDALHSAGQVQVKFGSLNSTLYSLARRGDVARVGYGSYALSGARADENNEG